MMPPMEKIFWNECIVFISKDNRLNKAHIKYLGAAVIPSQKADRYYIENSTIPADASLTEAEQAEMEEFLYNIRMINNVLGHKVLESLVAEEVGDTESASQILYIQAAHGANAKGMQTNEGFVVLKGSQVADTRERSCPKQICTLRQKLTENGSIDANWTLQRTGCSAVPPPQRGVVMGRSANGLTEWRVP